MTRSLLALFLFSSIAVAEPPAPAKPDAAPQSAAPVRALPSGITVEEVQAQLAQKRLDGWLLTDFRGQDERALDLVVPRGAPTRRWFFLIPKKGEPTVLAFSTEARNFEALPGAKQTYASAREMESQLAKLLHGRRRVALDYSPRGNPPTLSHVDAGTVELVRSAGAQVVSSGELVAQFCGRLSDAQRASHFFAARQIAVIKDEVFHRIADAVAMRARVTELDLVEQIAQGLAARGLEAETPPVVAAGAHSADPDYWVAPESAAEIHVGDIVRVEVAARQANLPDAVFAEGAWTAYVGSVLPPRLADAWTALRTARVRATELFQKNIADKKVLRGFEVDQAARAAVEQAKLGALLRHATGRSLGVRRFGDAPDLDALEVRDERPIPVHSAYVVGPGLYADGEWGMRTALDLFVDEHGIEITLEPQEEVALLGAPNAPSIAPATAPAPRPQNPYGP